MCKCLMGVYRGHGSSFQERLISYLWKYYLKKLLFNLVIKVKIASTTRKKEEKRRK